ncbi:hypothetical protein BOX15_Mlig014452g3 [Macrostomum lignano]|uniref:acylglycerol lipase n=1 Tax=Macrostomum lignano TaxID=282301 RepID=A0A267H3U9_9PLAT|nr:hypothetical protein BOX15_Mlig014452g3 [Macrostomum lignano]
MDLYESPLGEQRRSPWQQSHSRDSGTSEPTLDAGSTDSTLWLVSRILYPLLVCLINFSLAIGAWLCLLHPLRLYRLLRWLRARQAGLRFRLVPLDGAHYRLAEKGRPDRLRPSLLLLHSVADDCTVWTEFVRLADSTLDHVIAVDLPGHGGSLVSSEEDFDFGPLADRIRKVLLAAGLPPNQRLHAVGCGAGAGVALALAVGWPSQVELLTMVSPLLPPLTTGDDGTGVNKDGNDRAGDGNDRAGDGNDRAGDGNDRAGDGNDRARDGNDRASDGNDRAGDGNDRARDGNDRASDGNDRARDGNDRASDGNDRASDGNDRARDGNDRAGNGNDRAGDGNDRASDGNDRVGDGNDRARDGNDRAREGNDKADDGNDRADWQRYNSDLYNWLLPYNQDLLTESIRRRFYRPAATGGLSILWWPMRSVWLSDRLPKLNFYRALLANLAEEPGQTDLLALAGRVRVPAHIVWGAQDEISPAYNADLLRDRLQNLVQFDLLDECGHCPETECPGVLYNLVHKFRKNMSIKKYK